MTSQKGLGRFEFTGFPGRGQCSCKAAQLRWEIALQVCAQSSVWPEITSSLGRLGGVCNSRDSLVGGRMGCPELFYLGISSTSKLHLPLSQRTLAPSGFGVGNELWVVNQPHPQWSSSALLILSTLSPVIAGGSAGRVGTGSHFFFFVTTSSSPTHLGVLPTPQISLQNPCSARWTVRQT